MQTVDVLIEKKGLSLQEISQQSGLTIDRVEAIAAGRWLFGVAASPADAAWTAAGPLALTGLFVGISIPLIEHRMLAKRPHYAEVRARVSMLIPLPPRRQRPAGE